VTQNVTIALERSLVEKARAYAAERGTTLNGLVRWLLEAEVYREVRSAVAETFRLMDQAEPKASSGTWDREEIHERDR